MAQPLQKASEVIDYLLQPPSLVQLAVIAAAVALGWWVASLLRPRFTSTEAPDDLHGRMREAAWVAAPYGVILLILATADGLMHALRAQAHFADVAVQLTGLLLLIRVVVYRPGWRSRATSPLDSPAPLAQHPHQSAHVGSPLWQK